MEHRGVVFVHNCLFEVVPGLYIIGGLSSVVVLLSFPVW